MKIKYKILWFDDNEEFFNSLDHSYVSGSISSWGLEPEIELVTDADKFMESAPFGDYDLLVVDYQLEGHGHGQDFISKVREQEVLTEVVFYSSNSVSYLWDAVYKDKLEGVFIASRGNVQDRILQVGFHSMRKVLDVENVRGIVMAEVGSLDLLIENILILAVGRVRSEVIGDIYDRFYQACCDQHDKRRSEMENFNATPTIEGLISLCDSDKRWQNYMRLSKHVDALGKIDFRGYQSEVLTPRNFLAHGVPERLGDGGYLFRHRGKEYEFNDAVGASLRLKIIEYKRCLLQVERELADISSEGEMAA